MNLVTCFVVDVSFCCTQVVFIAQGQTRHQVQEYASKCPVLFVRGDVVFRWCLFLAHTYRNEAGFPGLDPDVVRSYRGVNGVPECLVESAVVATDENEADQLRAAHLLPCMGYAATRFGAVEDPGEVCTLSTPWIRAKTRDLMS